MGRWMTVLVVALVVIVVLATAPMKVEAVPTTQPKPVVPKQLKASDFMVQYRGVGFHSLGRCWAKPIRHVHVELWRTDPLRPGRWTRLFEAHIGKDGKCFVLWATGVASGCWTNCNGSTGLKSVVMTFLIIVIAVIGVTLMVGVLTTLVRLVMAPALALP